VLVNSAAAPLHKAALDLTPEQWDSIMNPNLKGTFFLTQQVAKGMIQRGTAGSIISMASTHGMVALADRSTYGIAKAGIIHMTRQLAGELGATRVVGVAPGLIVTDFAQMLVDNFGDTLAKRLPTKRLGQPQDIANLVAFLASDLASWITGETYVIDGGAGVTAGTM